MCTFLVQDKEVTIYRLVSRDTYEQHVFETSSRKYGAAAKPELGGSACISLA